MKEFRIGQRVRVVRSPCSPEFVGCVGTIISKRFEHGDGGYQEIEFDEFSAPHEDPWCGPIDCLEPIDDDKGDWRVIEHVTKWNPTKEKAPS